MDTKELTDMLIEAIEVARNEEAVPRDLHMRTYADSCLLTNDDGIVIKVGGSEFQLTIIQVR